MKALSLWQPWATLCILGEKEYETRSWGTAYRGPLIIHAAKSNDGLSIINDHPFRAALHSQHWNHITDIPRGVALGVVDLVDCIQMTPELIGRITMKESFFGDWKPGRYAWKLANPRPYITPQPMRGMQGLFEANL